MNWGYKLLFLYISFVVLILFLVFKANTTKFDLVSDKYYQEEINYQQTIDARNNITFSNNEIIVSKAGDQVTISLNQKAKTEVDSCILFMYCPQDASLDKKFKLLPSADSLYTFQNSALKNHQFQLKLSAYKGKKLVYYREE